jgi:hypothetical protein
MSCVMEHEISCVMEEDWNISLNLDSYQLNRYCIYERFR